MFTHTESGVESLTVDAVAWSHHVQCDPWRQHPDTAEAQPRWLRDVHVFSCEPGRPADQNLHPVCFRSGGIFCLVSFANLVECSFTSDLFCPSSSVHLWWDHSAQRGPGDPGRCCDAGVPGSGKPSSSDQLAEERTPSAPLSSYTSSLCWLRPEVSSDRKRVQRLNILSWITVFCKIDVFAFYD